MRAAVAVIGLVPFTVALIAPRPLSASPQYNAAIVAGIAGQGSRPELWERTAFYGGIAGDAVFGRESPRDFGAGPRLEIATIAFDDVRLGAGATVHVPVHETFPILLSAGGYARHGSAGWEPGASARLFFGARSYNYHADYVLAGGLLAGFDYGFGETKETAIVLGVQVDALVLALPFVIAYQALR